jgi:hypothetical protein
MTRAAFLLGLAGAAAASAVGACSQIGSDPAEIVAVVFDSLPYPAVIIGDTLRNDAGAVTALRAIALNSDGDEIPGVPFTFIALDSGATITPDGRVVSTDTQPASIRVIANASSGLQSRTLSLLTTFSPDSMARETAVDTLSYVLPDGVANTSGALAVRVLSKAVTPPAAARGWIVRYAVEYGGAPLSPADSTVAWLVDENGRRSAEDTTATDGTTSRRLRVLPTGLTNTVDSLIVVATATRHGVSLIGSPARIVVHVRPQ